ncbi:MAG: hypothetical protein M1167_06015 [Chloroflexi bacterium]|nr:hypothetical protein [Chloroflexota bacterium]
MGYQPRIKSPRGEYRKPIYEKNRDRKHIHRHTGKPVPGVKHTATEREISEATLKRLHTLGIQKFGSSPFSEHFDRWLVNVEAVLGEFESHPNIGVDDQFVRERSQTLSIIKLQLENRRRKEASLNHEISNLSEVRNQLKQINTEYAAKTGAIKGRKNREIKRLYKIIDHLKTEQDTVIRMKTGFFHGISKKERERREIEIIQQLIDKQNELELLMLDFTAVQKEVREEYERKREPVLKQIKYFQKIIQELETDGSLEERWFACEALIDAVNTFLQRKSDPAALTC